MNKELTEHDGVTATMAKTDAAMIFKQDALELMLPKPENINFKVEQGSPAYVATIVATLFHDGNEDVWQELERRFIERMDEMQATRTVN